MPSPFKPFDDPYADLFNNNFDKDAAGFHYVPGPVCSERYQRLVDSFALDPDPVSRLNYCSPRPDLTPVSLGRNPKPAQLEPRKEHQRPIPENVQQFVLKHYAEAQKIAAQLGNGVTAAEVLAVAGNESTWGSLKPEDGLARFGNYFGLHGRGPKGTYKTKGSPSVETPIFDITPDDGGFHASGQEFVKLVKQKVVLTPGIGDDPGAFFEALHRDLKYAAPNAHYAEEMARTKPRGKYEMVRQCIEQLKQEGRL